jgi:hypothetical protein
MALLYRASVLLGCLLLGEQQLRFDGFEVGLPNRRPI